MLFFYLVPLITAQGRNSFSSQEVPNAAFENPSHLPMMVARIPFPQGPQSIMFSPSFLIAVSFLSLATKVIAHEHHDDEIPEGEAISADPIVVLPPLKKRM